MIHRINIFLLCLFVGFNPILLIHSANASNNIGGWTLSNPVAQGAKVAYDGLKNVMINGANVTKKATAIIVPNANEVAKVLGKGVAGVALSVAVEQLLGAVDWVLDPENNEIRYKIPIDPSCDTKCLFSTESNLPKASTASEACKIWGASLKLPSGYSYSVSYSQDNWKETSPGGCGADIFDNKGVKTGHTGVRVYKEVVPVQNEDREARIPLPQVASQVIANAQSDSDPKRKADAQSAILAAAADIVDEAEKDATKAPPILKQLENGATAETDEVAKGETKPNAETGGTDISLTFPVFCTWAPTVCEAMNVVIAFPTAIAEYMTAVKDWFAVEEAQDTDTKVVIEEPEEPEINNNYLSWNAYCPFSSNSSEISLNGQSSSVDSDLTSWCTMASEIRPFVILAGAIASLMIVSGVGIGRGDD